jgi:hypothetical protein
MSALTGLAGAAAGLPRPTRVDLPSTDKLELEPVMLPRDAFFAAKETVDADNATGGIAAEQITPHPPGIPVIVPGERITAELLKYLRSGLAAGMQLPDPADPSLQTIRVVAPHLILATADGGEGLRHSRGDAAGVKPGTSPARARARPLEPTHWGLVLRPPPAWENISTAAWRRP